ncbi:hypothetical protein D7D52_17935 [Nocardia yunnanensis]|uniref:Uncharacterized protein n=1 Tax=Nocardia yunnanensis TaxID=2382165 RepID=A0A386ZFM7_9NOCA|nr:hypothetical protein [Nocardia yunnanensis]AYF75425.1 hypothetical protein D7D52_17935 [Nocardia yunnanensis]
MGRIVSAVIGVVLCVVGVVWIVQGLGSLHGSPMTGHSEWTYLGAVLVVVGAGLLLWTGLRSLRR